MTDDEKLMQQALEALGPYEILYSHIQQVAAALRERLARQSEMDEAIAAGDGTLHGAIDRWQERALKAEALLARQEPVAWMQEMPTEGDETRSVRLTTVEALAKHEWPNPIPLYTHPQPAQQPLTDEMIDRIYTGIRAVHHDVDCYTLARAAITEFCRINGLLLAAPGIKEQP